MYLQTVSISNTATTFSTYFAQKAASVSRSGIYASLLFITPHYLSDISREISGKPAGYWIDRFAVTDIIRAGTDTNLTLSEISEQFNFRTL